MRSSTRHEPRHLGAGMAVLGRLRPVAVPGSALVGRRVETAAKASDPRSATRDPRNGLQNLSNLNPGRRSGWATPSCRPPPGLNGRFLVQGQGQG